MTFGSFTGLGLVLSESPEAYALKELNLSSTQIHKPLSSVLYTLNKAAEHVYIHCPMNTIYMPYNHTYT
ncbi:hypothetical protein HanLR1_Chr10g0349751 [Helianthus annuus]|nr:hypothetical protein HanHA89_Chr10g0371531 [Helianthus annuus]KAJ0695811.1 hypothetical protein HanLR1_Chr10g0349751 [Helianthus annuus]